MKSRIYEFTFIFQIQRELTDLGNAYILTSRGLEICMVSRILNFNGDAETNRAKAFSKNLISCFAWLNNISPIFEGIVLNTLSLFLSGKNALFGIFAFYYSFS